MLCVCVFGQHIFSCSSKNFIQNLIIDEKRRWSWGKMGDTGGETGGKGERRGGGKGKRERKKKNDKKKV